jgi:hypothetical protein
MASQNCCVVPFCRGVRRHITVHDASRPNFHHEEDIEHSEASGHDDQKITGHDGLRVIPKEGSPMLREGSSRAASLRFRRPILAQGPGRNIDSKFTDSSAVTRACPQVGFSRAMRLIRSRISLGRRGRPTRESPEQLEALAMPADESLGLDDTRAFFQSKSRDHSTRERRADHPIGAVRFAVLR